MFHKIRLRLRAWFFTGLAVLLPAVISIKVLWWVLGALDNLLRPVLEDILREYFFGIGILLTLALVTVVGMLTQNYLGRKLVRLVEGIFDRLPFVRTIYSVVRQILELFSSEKGNSFRKVVLVEYPMEGRFAIGLVANEEFGYRNGEKLITVFVPTNHLYLGALMVVPEGKVTMLDIGVEEALKIIVSCGIVVPKTLDIGTRKLGAEET